MVTNREELLHKLEAVAPGLAVKEVIEQSSCFVFQNGRVMTFNDEVGCAIECSIGIEGAVAARPLIDLLNKMAEELVDIGKGKEGEILVKGKNRRAGITMEAEITLPIASVEPPTEWKKLHPEFPDAVGVVQQCAGKDMNNFHLTCIHITADRVEACDNYQLARYPLKTGITGECLVKRDSIRHVAGLGMTEVCETKSWLHFRNPTGLVLSVRREVLDYVDLDPLLKADGTLTTLPGGLAEAVEKAEIFSAQNSDNNEVFVELKDGVLRLRGVGATGWYEERRTIKWGGEPISFSISPKLLVEITTRTNDCFIAPGRLRINSGKFEYVTCLGKVN